MLYDFALLSVVGVGLWIALGLLGGVRRSAELAQLLALALTMALWAGGELLIQFGRSGSEILFGRRILYAGSCFLPVVWLWIAARAAGAGWARRVRPGLLVLATPAAVFYSCLYWDTQGRFIVWTELQPMVGAWFWAFAGYAWSLILVGTVYFVALASRHGTARPLRAGAILAAASIPMLANVLHLFSGFEGRDLTPILVGVSGVLIRVAVIDSGLVSVLPGARRAVIEQLDAGVLVANLQGVVVDVNPTAARLLESDDPVGHSYRRLLERARADTSRVIEVREFPVRGVLGEVGSCAFLTDRTEARRAEQQLLLAQRLESLGILAAGIAHEVNNPLAFVRGNLGFLEELAKDLSQQEVLEKLPDELRESAAEAGTAVLELRDGVDRIAQLVVELKRFTRSDDRQEHRPVCLRRVAERAASMADVGLTTGTIRRRFEAVPMVSGSESQLVQVVLNLLVNAIQASGGRAPIDLHLASERNGVCLSVRDPGTGIPDEVLPHLFDPFFTTKAPGEGTGLGLSLSFDLVRQHGGTLQGRNCPDGGACFELWLPARPEEARPDET